MRNIIISPSIMTADFSRLGEEIGRIDSSGAEWIHLDVMDGTFVPNISFGPKVISDINRVSERFLDAHLMVQNPDHLIEAFVKAGCDSLTVHYEACVDIGATLAFIRGFGVQCGVSIKPATPVSAIEPYLDEVDQVLVMSVEPGFGGQSFMPASIGKVRELSDLKRGRGYLISIDGGIGLGNIGVLRDAGVDAVVCGSSFFNSPDPADFVKRMSHR